MTLYSYFRNKNELLDGVADHILGSLVLPSVDGHGVEEGLRLVGHALRDMMCAHPSVIRLFSSRTTRSERAMHGSYERVLQVLIDLGLDHELAARTYGLLLVYALGFSSYELPREWGRDPASNDRATELRRQRTLFYQALPKDEFPVMGSLSHVLVTLPSVEQFAWGLEAIIFGVLSRIHRAT